ncbi:MAG TPA: hypothetical protein VMU76_11675 [Acidimicrobiales bacterium]|nr:hypothetical protein [Acidimicrobiales bacterium]
MIFATDDKMEPALEMSIEDDHSPVLVRLVGTLDDTTSASLLSLMNDLFNEGVRQVVLDVDEVQITAPGATALTLCQRLARESGASLLWDGVPFVRRGAVAPEEDMASC